MTYALEEHTTTTVSSTTPLFGFLTSYDPRRGALRIHVVNFGTTGCRVYSPKPVVLRFPYRTDKNDHSVDMDHVLSIARLEDIDMARSPQTVRFPYLKQPHSWWNALWSKRKDEPPQRIDTDQAVVHTSSVTPRAIPSATYRASHNTVRHRVPHPVYFLAQCRV